MARDIAEMEEIWVAMKIKKTVGLKSMPNSEFWLLTWRFLLLEALQPLLENDGEKARVKMLEFLDDFLTETEQLGWFVDCVECGLEVFQVLAWLAYCQQYLVKEQPVGAFVRKHIDEDIVAATGLLLQLQTVRQKLAKIRYGH